MYSWSRATRGRSGVLTVCAPGEGETHRKAYLVERVLKSLMPLEYHGLLHPLTGLGRGAKEPS